ncbi:MAG: serine hydrolase domain-containing protein [Pirellulales bacterium]
MQYRPFAVVVCALLIALCPQCFGGEDFDALRQELDKRRVELKAPGAIVAVYRAGQDDFEAVLGLADVEHNLPMSSTCAFRIGSISKVFVGQTVLLLAGEGKLSLDDPIGRYVDGVPHGDRITLRHLGNHRSGLFNHIESPEVKRLFAEHPEKQWSTGDLLRFCITGRTYFEPGENHHYANGNTVLLALVIEKVTDGAWADAVRTRILEPLELSHTVIPTDNRLPDGHAQGYALGTEEGPFFHRGLKPFRVTDTSPSWWGPAGSMISTLGDLRKAARPLATGQLLTPAMRDELHRWTKADQSGYEYGFHMEHVRGGMGHDGDVPAAFRRACITCPNTTPRSSP